MEPAQKVLITGGSGFIGKHVISMNGEIDFVNIDIRRPEPQHDNCISYLADVRNEEQLRPIFEQYKFSCIFHLAAAHKDFGVEQDEYFSVNEGGTALLCRLATEFNIPKIIFYSSVAVYGERNEPTNDYTNPMPTNDYGASKLAAELVINNWYRENEERTAIVLRPALVFGEGNVANMFRLIDQINRGRYFNVGKGDNIKSTAYVKNLVEATIYLFQHQQQGFHVYNYADEPHLRTVEIGLTIASALGKPKPRSVPRSLLLLMAKPFDILIKLSGRDLPISSMRVRKYGSQTYHKAQQVFAEGFKPRYSTQEGLTRMVAWYKETQSNS
jgi:nucleoside-diphosphate-sugar epimerase